MDDDGAAMNGGADLDRGADDHHGGDGAARVLHLRDSFAHGGQEHRLHVQIVQRVARQAEFREHAQGCAGLVRLAHQFDGLAGVGGGVGKVHARAGRGHPHEAVRIEVVEFRHLACAYHGGLPALNGQATHP